MMHCLRRMIIFMMVVCMLPLSVYVMASDDPTTNIVVLHSYHKGLQWTDELQMGIESSLGESKIQYSIEYLDSYRQGKMMDPSDMATYFMSKYEKMSIDYVVVTDNFAFNFLSDHSDQLFVGLPVIFAGINNYSDELLFREEMTGVAQTDNHRETISLIQSLHPNVETIVAIGCDNPTALSEVDRIIQVGEQAFPEIDYKGILDDDIENQIEALKEYDTDSTAIIVAGTMVDKGVFYNHGEYAGRLIDQTGIAVYAMADIYLYDHGAVGGYVVKAFEQGEEIGEYLKRLIDGEPIDEIDVNKSPKSSYMFNFDRVNEFGFERTDLPPQHELVEGPKQALSLSKDFLILFALLISVILVSMVLLIISSLRRKKAELVLEEHAHKLEHMAYHDFTTDLYNRAYLIEYLQKQLLEAKNTFTALYNLDIVNLKMINDAYGHDVGDRVLQHVAELLKEEFGSENECIGIYHTELLIVDHTRTDIESVKARISHLIRQLSHTTIIDYMEINIKVNVGISLAPEHSIDAKLLLKKANIALIESTKYGPNHYHVFEDTLYKDVLKRITLEKQLRRAVNNDEFVIFYQPRINVEDMTVSGCEALIRWNHPDGHLVYPNHFIPLAESVGFIEEITRWVIKRVSTQVMEWSVMGYNIKVSFNISGKEFDDDFIKMLREIIAEVKVDPTLLEVEITETAALKDIDHSKILVDTLNDIGLSVALDDFGTGYSSMTYIKKLRASKLKIDKTFIDDIEEYEQKVVVDSMIQLGQKLDYRINVEGVETEEQLRILKYLKVDEIQGWLFSKAVPADDFIDYVNMMLESKEE